MNSPYLVLLRTVDSAYFKDKVALITGSSRGIGKAIALRLAGWGADVVLNYRKAGGSSQAKAEELCEEIKGMGRRSVVMQADISQKASVRALVGGAAGAMGRLDFLVLNAARAPFKSIERLLEREIKQLVETNYSGNIFCLQEALPHLEKTQGKVVFISSLGSRFYNPAYPLGSMKAAMEAVVRDCAESLRHKRISVNAVCAGIVRTDTLRLLRRMWEDVDRMPDELIVEPEEVADAVAFLLSPLSRGILGQSIVLDKGLSSSLFRYSFQEQ